MIFILRNELVIEFYQTLGKTGALRTFELYPEPLRHIEHQVSRCSGTVAGSWPVG